MLPDDLFQHNGTDIMTAALVLVGTMGGADEEVLTLFKIAGGRVVELLLAVVAEYTLALLTRQFSTSDRRD